MAVRSVNITFLNYTGFMLQLTDSGLIPSGLYGGGEWSSGAQPPATIANGAQVSFQSESDGVMVGTQGAAIYKVLDTGPPQLDPNGSGTQIQAWSWIYLCWDNPYALGSTSFNTKIETSTTQDQPVDLNDNPTGTLDFPGQKPPISLYEVGPVGGTGSDGTPADTNWGDAVPFVAFINLFGDENIVAHASVAAVVRPKATDAITWAKRNNVDLTKGFRVLNPPNGSLRALFQLPPASSSAH